MRCHCGGSEEITKQQQKLAVGLPKKYVAACNENGNGKELSMNYMFYCVFCRHHVRKNVELNKNIITGFRVPKERERSNVLQSRSSALCGSTFLCVCVCPVHKTGQLGSGLDISS